MCSFASLNFSLQSFRLCSFIDFCFEVDVVYMGLPINNLGRTSRMYSLAACRSSAIVKSQPLVTSIVVISIAPPAPPACNPIVSPIAKALRGQDASTISTVIFLIILAISVSNSLVSQTLVKHSGISMSASSGAMGGVAPPLAPGSSDVGEVNSASTNSS